MKRLILATALGAILAVGVTAAEASHKPKHTPKAKKCEVNKAFVVKGVLTDTSTVTTTGVQNFDVTGANSHAKKAGYGPDTTTTDSANDRDRAKPKMQRPKIVTAASNTGPARRNGG